MTAHELIRSLYNKLLALYPAAFRERFGEAMQLTFQDLLHERSQARKSIPSFVFWSFVETGLGVFQEHLTLIIAGGFMQTMLKNMGLAGAISLLLTMPLAVMEMINRKNFHEVFPLPLFLFLWFNLFAISVIIAPILQGVWLGRRGTTAQAARPSAEAGPLLLISMILLLSLVLFGLMTFLTSGPDLTNGPDPEKISVFGMSVSSRFLTFLLMGIPVAIGMIAGLPIIRTLRTGGSLFAHPVHLMVVTGILVVLILGLTNLVVDQWPCFIGVPNCD